MKCIEFSVDRDVDLTQTCSDWVLENGAWGTFTTNSSGLPAEAHVTIEWPQPESKPTVFPSMLFERDPALNDTFRLNLSLDDQREQSRARRIGLRFRWLGGGVLAKSDLAYFDESDLAYFDESKLDEFRRRGQEFCAIRTPYELQSMSLMVRLPRQFAPKPEDI